MIFENKKDDELDKSNHQLEEKTEYESYMTILNKEQKYNGELIVISLPIKVNEINKDGEFIKKIKEELSTDKYNLKVNMINTDTYLSKKSNIGAIYTEKIWKNKKTNKIKKEYIIEGLSGISYEPVNFLDFLHTTNLNSEGIFKIFESNFT